MRALWLLIVGSGFLAAWPAAPAAAQQKPAVQWIWFDEGDPAKAAPVETRYFRKVFAIDRPIQKVVDEGTLDITADNAFTVWINGTEVGRGDNWKRVFRIDVTHQLIHGPNVIAVEARNTDRGPAGLLVRLAWVPNGMDRRALASDNSWKASKTAADGWRTATFDDAGWQPVKELGRYGQVGPWKGVVWDGGGDERFTVPEGFKVELVVPPRPAALFGSDAPAGVLPRKPGNRRLSSEHLSLINMCFDAKGRLMVSQEQGPILVCTEPDKDGVLQNIRPYCEQVRNCQGMCWVKDALLLVGDGPSGTGLYRVKDTDNDDKTDEAKLLHKFRGSMGEHGPHAIIHGPDNWLYLVAGNHAWAQIGPDPAKNGVNPEKLAANSPLTRWPTGHFGPDQGRTDTNEDVLLPRLNDGRGHAANILSPGGTIWRFDHEGKNWSLVNAGFRNHYDAAFNPAGELFTFDSDMEWDEALPWYRQVRVCHCTPGADFVWRTGAANTPDYYIDSLAPTVETGRGSPVGVEFYDHDAFPEKYRGAFFMADWAIGVIFAVHLERDGASCKGKAERFCVGAPMNVTDLAVGPDGAIYFTMGGRGTQGGVYRIGYGNHPVIRTPLGRIQLNPNIRPIEGLDEARILLARLQPLSAWRRAEQANIMKLDEKTDYSKELIRLAEQTPKVDERIRALDLLQQRGRAEVPLLLRLAQDRNAEVRAQAVYLLGLQSVSNKKSEAKLLDCLRDSDALVRRRACEALIRAGIEPPVEAVWPLLGDKDRFVRTAARLVVERIEPKKWTDRLWKEPNDHIVLQGIIALCKHNNALPYTEQIFEQLHHDAPQADVQALLDHLRTIQMALIHTTERPGTVRGIALDCLEIFPHKDWRVNRELAILLTHFRKENVLDEPVHTKLLMELLKEKDRQQQIHYFLCLRFLHTGWSPEQKSQLLAWFDSAKDWVGGHSFTPFMENILRALGPAFTAEDQRKVIAKADQMPWAAKVMLQIAPEGQALSPAVLAEVYPKLNSVKPASRANELKEAVFQVLRQSNAPETPAVLRRIADADPPTRDAVAAGLARFPSAENYSYLLRGLQANQAGVLIEVIQGLRKVPTKPKTDDPAPFRVLLLASSRLEARDRWKVVELLRHWTNNKQFGAEDGEWRDELNSWSRWFAQTFPKELPLPNIASDKPVESKYKFDELLAFLEKDPKGKTGDVVRGRVVFEKANCLKCHKFGKDGEGIGPDLTTLKSRFTRRDTLESMYLPSKVISDQYRGTTIVTKKGTLVTGLAAPQGNEIVVLKIDGTKETLKTDEIERQFASTISAMPEKLLDELTLQEIADLFAFLDSEPPK